MRGLLKRVACSSGSSISPVTSPGRLTGFRVDLLEEGAVLVGTTVDPVVPIDGMIASRLRPGLFPGAGHGFSLGSAFPGGDSAEGS